MLCKYNHRPNSGVESLTTTLGSCIDFRKKFMRISNRERVSIIHEANIMSEKSPLHTLSESSSVSSRRTGIHRRAPVDGGLPSLSQSD